LVSSLTSNASYASVIRKNHTGALLFVRKSSSLLGAEGTLLLELGLLLFPKLLVDLGALAGLVAVVLGLDDC
jgi:hypothetical protein